MKQSLYIFFACLLFIIASLIYFGSYSDLPVETLKTEYANSESRFVSIDSMEVHYRDEGSGKPVVLLHGTASSLHTWDSWSEVLSKQYRVIRLDLPAFGLTGPNLSGDYSIDYYTDFLNRFLSKINIQDSIYLAGNSLGGRIAWEYALKNPEKVSKLVLIDAAGFPKDKEEPLAFKLARNSITSGILKAFTPKAFIEKSIKEVYYDDSKIKNELIDRYHALTIREGNRQAFIYRVNTEYPGRTRQLINLTVPTLIIWGRHDEWIAVENAFRFDSLLANAQIFIDEHSGHVPMEENPQVTVEQTTKFLETPYYAR